MGKGPYLKAQTTLAEMLAPVDLVAISDWRAASGLDSGEFEQRLTDWLHNFPDAEDRRLAVLLLCNSIHYSHERLTSAISERLQTVKQLLRHRKINEDEVYFVVGSDRLDSSRMFPYHLSKVRDPLIRGDNVLDVAELNSLEHQASAVVVFNDTQGSGQQFERTVWPLVSAAPGKPPVMVCCIELFDSAIQRFHGLSDQIRIIPFDPTPHSLTKMLSDGLVSEREVGRIREIGIGIEPTTPLGYEDCGLLVSYYYQCPNNTLPIFWSKSVDQVTGRQWTPLFEYKEKAPPSRARPARQTPSISAMAKRGLTGRLAKRSTAGRLRDMIQSKKWIAGAVNFDEDLHFSSFYLRASSQLVGKSEEIEYGYSSIVSIYRDFNESYYIPEDECRAVAERLLRKVISAPEWLQEVIQEIAKRSEALDRVFNFPPQSGVFRDMPIEDVIKHYLAHNHAHADLYRVARIPEAMDRGFGLFTEHLKSELKAHMGSEAADTRAVNSHFQTLTFPEEASLAHAAWNELGNLAKEIQGADADGLVAGSSKRILLRLDPTLRAKVTAHRDKWSYWGYHGYGSRALPDVEEYLRKMEARGLNDDARDGGGYTKRLGEAERERGRLVDRLGIGSGLEILFRLHSRIGLVKLRRRFHQLRNFFFLDQLLERIAKEIGETEAVVRSLLPDELERILQGKATIGTTHRARVDKCVYVIAEGEERVIAADEPEMVVIEALLPGSDRGRHDQRDSTLVGTCASEGRVSGFCRVLIRPNDAEKSGFKPGDILVSESTDMDLEDLMRRSGGVITEAGGATCHAAIICREIGKPALVGVKDAITRLSHGEYVVLDATAGTVSIEASEPGRFAVNRTAAYLLGAPQVGTKAYNLARMARANIDIPPFFCIPIQQLAEGLSSATSDSVGPARQEIAIEIDRELSKLNGDLFVLRSSMATEDLPNDSQAGRWPTELGIWRQDVAGLVFKYWEWLAAQGFGSEVGSLVVQEMILGDASGVFMTKDPRGGNSDEALLEIVPGGNEPLTDGKINPVRYSVDRDTHHLTFVENHGHLSRYVSENELRRLVEICHQIEGIFGGPQDIEWTVEGGTIKILQSRPITGLSSQPPSAVPRRTAPFSNSFSALYRALKIPPNLQKHLLRVAAVADLICEGWHGPEIDRELILGTLLVHDIGNIVKADYSKFPALFPEEMRRIGYWKTIQETFRKKYGENDVEASVAIAKEIGASEKIVDLLRRKQFLNNLETERCDDFNQKIAAYADQRVGPYGVLSLEERLAEAQKRYKGVPYASVNTSNFDSLVASIFRVELQIQANTAVEIERIDDAMIALGVDTLGQREWSMLSLGEIRLPA